MSRKRNDTHTTEGGDVDMRRSYITQGERLVHEAESALNSRFEMVRLFSESKYRIAADKFLDAAQKFKMVGEWKLAGDAFMRSFTCEEKLPGFYTSAKCLRNAAEMMTYYDIPMAILYYNSLLENFTPPEDYHRMASVSETIGVLFRKISHLEDAVTFFDQSVQLYRRVDASTRALQCQEQVAKCMALLKRYDEAATMFEVVGIETSQSRFLKLNVKKHFLHVVLCHLAYGDVSAAKQALVRLQGLDSMFEHSSDGEFCAELITCCENKNLPSFNEQFERFATYRSSADLDFQTTLVGSCREEFFGGKENPQTEAGV